MTMMNYLKTFQLFSQTHLTMTLNEKFFVNSTMLHPSVAIVGTLLNIMALSWILNLERTGCPCANDWRRKVLKYWYFLALLWPLVVFMLKPPIILTKMLGLFGAVAFFALASSLWTIQRQKCGCAQDWREKVLLVTTSLSVVGMGIAALK